MAKLTTRQRDRLPESAFAYPERAKLPIHDAAHVRSSLGRFSQTDFDSVGAMQRAARRILKAAKKHRISVSPESHVARAAGAGISGQRTGSRGNAGTRGKGRRRNPSTQLSALSTQDRKELETAKRLSKRFHGTPYEVVELAPSERRLSKYAVVAGDLEDFSYEPGAASKRQGPPYLHASGDRGMGRKRSGNKPLLVVDPITKRPAIVTNKSPMKFSSRRGFVG